MGKTLAVRLITTFFAHYRLRSMIAGLVIACLMAPVTMAAQQVAVQPLAKDAAFEVGGTVQLQGCVVEAERKGSYVFSRVTAWPVASSPNGVYGPRHFWLADAAAHDLGAHVGRTIQVTGTIVEVRESEVERNPGYESHHGQRVAIELPVGDIITTIDLAGVGKGERDSRIDMKITLLKVKIDSLRDVLATCLPTRF